MVGIIQFETFLLTGILLNITPGNDTIFILTRSIAQGKSAGVVSALGIAVGSFIHTLLATFGLSVIIAQSIILFSIVKYCGAIYLVYIGVRMFFDKSQFQTGNLQAFDHVDYWKIFRDGVFTNILNPKVAMFFIAFLPQFIDPHYQNSFLPFLLLGLTFITTGTIWCFILAIFASKLFSKLKSNNRIADYINKFCGMIMISLGIKIALFTDK